MWVIAVGTLYSRCLHRAHSNYLCLAMRIFSFRSHIWTICSRVWTVFCYCMVLWMIYDAAVMFGMLVGQIEALTVRVAELETELTARLSAEQFVQEVCTGIRYSTWSGPACKLLTELTELRRMDS